MTSRVLRVAVVLAAMMAMANCQCVMVPMRDGVQLSTCVTGASSTPRTAVLDRSPYGHLALELLADIFILFGFVAVGQDMRGTGQSEGNFTIWREDGTDGYDTMAWIAQQPWSNGEVFTLGASADGIASIMDLSTAPPALRAQFIIVAGSVGYEIIYPGGAFRYELAEGWLNKTVGGQAGFDISEVINHEVAEPWWDAIDMRPYYKNVNFPSVMWGGWYDIFIESNLGAFAGYQKRAAEGWAGHSKIVVDPLGHCQSGAKYFKKNLIAGRAILPILLGIATFQNSSSVPEGVEAVTFYVMSSTDNTATGNYWTTLPDWPAWTPMDLYLQADGVMSPDVPAGNESFDFVYDPTDPVPTLGGNNLLLPCGPVDLTPIESRSDVLQFTTAKLAEDVWVTGPLVVTLFVSSNATDTDFTAFLTDVYPTGESRLIQDGIIRMRWRSNPREPVPELMVPDEVYQVEISLWNTSYVFPAGHQIRLLVSSSNHPRFSVNPNNGLLLNETGPSFVAENVIYGSAAYPSKLTLPSVQPSQVPPHSVLNSDPMTWSGVDPRVFEAAEVFNKRMAELGNSL